MPLSSSACLRSFGPCALSFFFFQAEDGIRDGHVTGVQTCALPILREASKRMPSTRLLASRTTAKASSNRLRSEERRVGKEGRSGWEAEDGANIRRRIR